jgi:putative ABC transport system ATP-binding protein
MVVLSARELHKHYGKEPNMVRALNGIDLDIEEGEFVAIVGMSGSGKSTLLHMMGGLDRPTSGQVLVDGQSIGDMTDKELTLFRRRKVGFVFQSYNLLPVLNVYENIVLPMELDGNKTDATFTDEILDALGIWEKRNAMPDMLSGGQQQRAAIARALASKPSILLADEPTGNLDSKTGKDVLALFKNISEKFNQTLVMITHDENIARLANRVLHIKDGKITAVS